jgi:hypothetical protein
MAPFEPDAGEWVLLATPQTGHTRGIPGGLTRNKGHAIAHGMPVESVPRQEHQNGRDRQKWWHNACLTGSVAERLKAPVLKTGEGLRPS